MPDACSETLYIFMERLHSRNSWNSFSEVCSVCPSLNEYRAVLWWCISQFARAGEASISLAPTATSANGAGQTLVPLVEPLPTLRQELLGGVSRRLQSLLDMLSRPGSYGDSQPGGGNPASDLRRLTTICSVTISCAAAVHAAAQQSRSVVPQHWTADGLTKGEAGLPPSSVPVFSGCLGGGSGKATKTTWFLLQVGFNLRYSRLGPASSKR